MKIPMIKRGFMRVLKMTKKNCFKEDPEYGKLLQRMWAGDLSTKD